MQKIRQSSEDAVIAICLHPAFGTRISLLSLTQPPKKVEQNAKKSINSNKQIIGKYQTLIRILQDQDLVIEAPMHEQILKFSILGVQHALQDVRIVATKCIVELYKVMGERVRAQFGELRPAQIE